MVFASPRKPIDVVAHGRLVGLTEDGSEALVAPNGHSLLTAAAGSGKTVNGAATSLISCAASFPDKAILVVDSKNGELFGQFGDVLARYGRKVALIDPMGVFPADDPYRMNLNPMGAVVSAFRHAPEELVFATENANSALISDPSDDERNQYFRDAPKSKMELCERILLKRNPKLMTPGGLWSLLSNSVMLKRFAEIEAEEGDPALKALALNALALQGHEHEPQHREAALKALRIFSAGSKLHHVGADADITHAELIRQNYVIFLVGPMKHMARLGAYYALNILAFNDALYGGAGSLIKILDEFTNCPLNTLVENITTERGFGGENHMIAQSRSEIERKFGRLETETIEENAIVKQWFGFSSFAEAERIAKAIGEERVINHSISRDEATARLQQSYQLNKELTVSAAQLMAMPPHMQLVWVKGVGFFFARKLGQHQISPICADAGDNPVEGGRLETDPRIIMPFRNAAL
ncbi:MAG: TraM recognition domain-containing protein [Pseudomonadota bacterium]